jgi:hypothetical protein
MDWLDRRSDDVSPLVVKEVRQVVRGREFLFSLIGSLVAGLIVAFIGATAALSGSSASGRGTFGALMGCLAFLGLAVVPLAAFTTLRHERAEQTLELITLTSLSARRIVVGKLLSQSVKLLTLFAAIAPFIAMSFLLGGIDFTTILLSMLMLYMASVWVGALSLFLSTLFRSRAGSGIVLALVGVAVAGSLMFSVAIFQNVMRAGFVFNPSAAGASGAQQFKVLAMFATFWGASLVNFVLLADNRLSLATSDTVTPLRIGLFVLFLFIAGWAWAWRLTTARAAPAELLIGVAGFHLAVVAAFSVTEGMSVPRRVLQHLRSASGPRRLLLLFGPGAGRAAAYVVAQMIVLVGVVMLCRLPSSAVHRVVAECGYICFFTGVPVLALVRMPESRMPPYKMRVAVLCGLAAAMVLPDVIHYVIVQPETLDLSYSWRHLINPFRTITQWGIVEAQGWTPIPYAIGTIGLFAYILLFAWGARETSRAAGPVFPEVPEEGVPSRGGLLY